MSTLRSRRVSIFLAANATAACCLWMSAQAQQAPTALPPVPVDPVVRPQAASPSPRAVRSRPAKKKAAAARRTAVQDAPPAPGPAESRPQLPLGVIVDPNLPVRTTTAGAVQGYRALSAMSSTRTDTAVERIPQSIQVVPRSLIDDQGSVSVTEATRNVSGVLSPNPLQTPAYESTYVRGFPAEQWLDGMATYYNAGHRNSVVNVERIEVLKGPSAILYGGGSGAPLGGVVNVISKLPTDKAFSEFGVTFGSYKFIQPYFDVNQPLSKDGTILFRMTGEYKSAGSFIDVIDNKSMSFNPTLVLTNKSDTKLTIQGRISDWKQQEYQGLPATGTITGSFRIDPNLFVGPSNIPKSYSKVQSLTAKLDHQFDDVWSANVQARVSKTSFRELAQNFTDFNLSAGNVPQYPPSTWSLLNVDLFQEQKEFAVATNILAKFRLGESENKLLFGYDYTRLSDSGGMWGNINDIFNFNTFTPDLTPADLTNPAFPPYVVPARIPGNTIVDGDNSYTTQGAYAQLQSTWFDRIHLLGGVRLANLKIQNVSATAARIDTTDTTKVLPRVGAVVDIVKGFSVFASYSEGIKANPFAFYVGTPKPEESNQKEAGIKFNLGYGLSGTAAVFEINRSGVPVVTTGFLSEAIGEQRSRGYEVDVLWQLTENWQLLANYTHVDAVLTKNVSATAIAGNQLNIVPPESGRVWANYKFGPGPLRGWSVGAGVYAASGAFVDLANLYHTSSYFTIDSKIAYENERFSASITAKNLTGEHYFLPYVYYGGRVAPGDARAVYGKLAVKFN